MTPFEKGHKKDRVTSLKIYPWTLSTGTGTGKEILINYFFCPSFNPIALRTAKTLWSFGRFECNKANTVYRIGFPEVQIGILPGAAGTQRLPRVAGIPNAIEMITTGNHVSAEKGMKMGIIDKVRISNDATFYHTCFSKMQIHGVQNLRYF